MPTNNQLSSAIADRGLTSSRLTLPYMINVDNEFLDYTKYINVAPKKTDIKNQPTKLEFSMVPTDSSFVKLVRGNYISFQTALYGSWFTGYIINDPELSIVGSQNGIAVYGYSYVAMSDEYLINLKPLGIINPFFNLTQGKILASLINTLCPGLYDLSNIQDGLQLARYQVDPTNKFTDIVKDFCDSAQFVFYANSGKIYYTPISDAPFSVAIDGNDKHFTPSLLKLTPTSDPIINDATVLGGVEPQNHITEYFAGDGFTGEFNLVYSPFGIDSTVLLTDSFSGTSLDSTIWTLYDNAATNIQLSGGYVNVLGGSADGTLDVHLDSASPIPVEGQLKLTHGEWDFLPEGLNGADGVLGVICALWTEEPTGFTRDYSHTTGAPDTFPNCMYGLELSNYQGNQIINPIVQGVQDASQYIVVDTANRYVIRTLVSCNQSFRTATGLAYSNASGETVPVSVPNLPATYTFTTLFSLININTGVLMNQYTFTNTFTVPASTQNYALYIPIASNDTHCTFSQITLEYPIQGNLTHYPPPPSTTGVLDLETDGVFGTLWPKVYSPQLASLGQNEEDALDGMAPDATISDTVTGANTVSSLLGTPQYNTASAALQYFKDSVALVATTPVQGTLICLKYNAAGVSTGRVSDTASINAEAAVWKDDGIRAIVKTDFSPAPRTSVECELAAATMVGDSSFQHYEGNYTFNSDFRTFPYEPISGVNMLFQNLPVQFPNVQAETVTQVVSTFDSRKPHERFTHDVSFGPVDRVSKLLAAYNNPTDVFAPTDSLSMPITVSSDSVGIVFAPDVLDFQFAGMDANNYYYSILSEPPLNGGFEVRLSDDSWGSANSNNLVTRLPYTAGYYTNHGSYVVYTPYNNYTFSLPRLARSKLVFVRAYDGRNQIGYSENITKWPTNCTVTNSMLPNPEDEYSLISTVKATPGVYSFVYWDVPANTSGDIPYPNNNCPFTFTVDLKIPNNRRVVMTIEAPNNNNIDKIITGVGAWQRVSVSLPNTSYLGNRRVILSVFSDNLPSSRWAPTFEVTRASAENALAETSYFATNGTSYGALSRYASAVRVNFPLLPPCPATVSVAISGDLDTLNTVTTGSGTTATITTIQQVNAQGTPTENNPSITNPQVTVTLPALQIDIFGVEIRGADNKTVLYRQNLSAAGYSIAVSLGNTFSTRIASYYVYTYNIFGEYCAGVYATAAIPSPTVKYLSVNNTTQELSWTGTAAISYNVTIADDANGTNAVNFIVQNPGGYNYQSYTSNSFLLQNVYFIPKKYITVTPVDMLGNGTSVTIIHTAPSGSVGLYYRPSANTDSVAASSGSRIASVQNMNLAYDSDQTTYGTIQCNSGTTGVGASGHSQLTGFSNSVVAPSGMMMFALISFNINDDGQSGNSVSTNCDVNVTANFGASGGNTTAVMYDSGATGVGYGGNQILVNTAVPAGTVLSDITVTFSVTANPILINDGSDNPDPEQGQPIRHPSPTFEATSAYLSVYDCYAQ